MARTSTVIAVSTNARRSAPVTTKLHVPELSTPGLATSPASQALVAPFQNMASDVRLIMKVTLSGARLPAVASNRSLLRATATLTDGPVSRSSEEGDGVGVPRAAAVLVSAAAAVLVTKGAAVLVA